MEPRIQYATTSDGVSIAFWAQGEGPAIVQTPPVPFSQVQLAGVIPEDRRWGDVVAGRWRLVRYDARGSGLSERHVDDFSLEACMRDLEAVVDQLSVERLVIWGQITSGPVAIAYAARHPERVSQLILWSTWARSSDVLASPAAAGFLALIETDWELFTEAAAHAFFGWSVGELAHRAAVFMRDNVAPQAAKAMIDGLSKFDVTDLLPRVAAPTLVFQSREAPLPDISVARALASGIPDASLVVLEGTAAGWGLPGEALTAIDEFLGGGGLITAPSRPAQGTVTTILFTDISASTALTQRLGDAKAQELVRAHNAIVREALERHGGGEIKHTGDGIMASFPSASRALECAIAIQRAVGVRGDANLMVHIGLNAGEPVAEEEDLFGTAVQLARRICDQAESGEILVSNVVRELAAGKAFLFSDRGEAVLRGFEDPVRLYAVRWRKEP